MIRPVDAVVSQRYGDNPTKDLPATDWLIRTFGNYQPDGHSGEDYACKAGSPVRAVTDGTVLHIGWMGGTYADNPWWIQPSFAGYVAVIDHGAFIGIYGHCLDGSAKVSAGDRVSEGQVFVLSGNTGASTGDHLHFEILPDRYVLNSRMYGRVDPETLFTGTLGYASESIKILEEIDVSAEQNLTAKLDQIVGWLDGRVNNLAEQSERNRNMLAGFVRDVVNAKESITPEQIDAKFAELTAASKPAGQPLFKGDQSPEVYVWDAAGGFRHIDQAEYLTLITTGAVLKELPQTIINNAIGGK